MNVQLRGVSSGLVACSVRACLPVCVCVCVCLHVCVCGECGCVCLCTCMHVCVLWLYLLNDIQETLCGHTCPSRAGGEQAWLCEQLNVWLCFFPVGS